MPRNKSKDYILFNCSKPQDHLYVVKLYPPELAGTIREFLKTGCKNKLIFQLTNYEIYELIKEKFGYEIPV